jgi:3-methyl-2-oxobutanoate hydroxymethyltransferase
MQKRNTILDIKSRKFSSLGNSPALSGAQIINEPIVVLTSYSYNTARIIDEFVDIILVGDSLGMVLYGLDSTLQVTLDMMINHGKAVVKGSSKALVVVDLPFGSYQQSPAQAFESAAKVLAETGAQAIKLEGGSEMASTIQFLTERGIPVMAHVALQPQYFNAYGGYKYQGRNAEEAEKVLNDAIAVEKAGAFAVVLESCEKSLAEKITKTLKIPTIGIGASELCDGQVLVLDDMIGLSPTPHPKFVKKFSNISEEIKVAVQKYASEVKSRKFPAIDNCFVNKK